METVLINNSYESGRWAPWGGTGPIPSDSSESQDVLDGAGGGVERCWGWRSHPRQVGTVPTTSAFPSRKSPIVH